MLLKRHPRMLGKARFGWQTGTTVHRMKSSLKKYHPGPDWLRFLSSPALLLATSSLLAAPAGPEPQIPEEGGAPGAFPNTSVSGVNVIAKGSSSGFDGSVEITGLDGQGPISWSVNRYNRGDIALRLSPGDPVAALDNLNQGFIDFADNSPGLAANQAWRPSQAFGVVISTARQNGPVDWNDGEGPFFPTVAVSWQSSGPGYNMADGTFGTGNLDINLGRAGTHESSPEANFAFSTTWFPFDQGWLGGDVGTPLVDDVGEVSSQWSGANNHAAGLTAGLIRWLDFPTGSLTYGGLADLQLPGVNSLEDGLLFAASSDGGSDINILGVAPKEDGSGWLVTIREDSATDAETLVGADQSEFQFVYVPFDAERLIGGHILGATGAKRKAVGDFTLTRTATGTYELILPGKTGADGALLLQAADFEAGTTEPLATRAFLSYEFADGKFIIQSRKTTTDTTADLADANFYVAWVDFTQPLAPPAGPRLRNLDPVVVNGEDIPVSEANVAAHTTEPEVLVITIDTQNVIGFTDPISQQFATAAVVGRFYNPHTLEPTSEPFGLLGNPAAGFAKLGVAFNPVSGQYVVVANARNYSPTGNHVPHLALVNPLSVAGENSPLAKAFAYQPDVEGDFDDLAVAVSTQNGNFLLAAEHSFPDEGEGAVGVLFDQDGNLLTPEFTRLDQLQSVGDEDDPDVVYLPGRDVFLYVTNTDNSNGSDGTLSNRIVGSVVQTTPGGDGKLQTIVEQVLSDGEPIPEGHPASLENPFNGELLTAFDHGNGTANGEVSYYNIGAGPTYPFTSARPEIPYLSGTEGNPFRHQHPQLAVDPTNGVIALGHNARDSDIGLPNAYVVTLLGPDGAKLPSQLGIPYFVADSGGPIDNGMSMHTLKYSPVSGSFVIVFNAANATYLASLQVTSSHSGGGGETPELNIEITGANVVISWPATATGFVLEATDSLNPVAWSAAGGTEEEEGGLKKVTLTPGEGSKYYRLNQP